MSFLSMRCINLSSDRGSLTSDRQCSHCTTTSFLHGAFLPGAPNDRAISEDFIIFTVTPFEVTGVQEYPNQALIFEAALKLHYRESKCRHVVFADAKEAPSAVCGDTVIRGTANALPRTSVAPHAQA